MINLGDLTWSREFKLMCPTNHIGTIDLYLTNHHGLDQSGAPAFVHAIQPRVAIMNNGTRKGGAVQTFQTLETSPGFEDLWQLHWSYAGGVEHNAPGVMIANIDAPRSAGGDYQRLPPTPPAGPGGNAAHSPGALHQGVGAHRRLVHRHEQPKRILADVRRLDRKEDLSDMAAGLHQTMGFGSLRKRKRRVDHGTNLPCLDQRPHRTSPAHSQSRPSPAPSAHADVEPVMVRRWRSRRTRLISAFAPWSHGNLQAAALRAPAGRRCG